MRDKQPKNEEVSTDAGIGVMPGYASARGDDVNGFLALDRRSSIQRRRTDQAVAVGDVMDRAELLEMTGHLRDYLDCQRWDMDPVIRRQAACALAWMTDRGSAALIMRLGPRSVLVRGWPEVMQDMKARVEAIDLEQAERQLPGVSDPMEVVNHSQWRQASRTARLLNALKRRAGLSSFREPVSDPVLSTGSYLPPEEIRHRGPWSTGNGFFS